MAILTIACRPQPTVEQLQPVVAENEQAKQAEAEQAVAEAEPSAAESAESPTRDTLQARSSPLVDDSGETHERNEVQLQIEPDLLHAEPDPADPPGPPPSLTLPAPRASPLGSLVVNVTGNLGRTAPDGLTVETSAAPRLVRLVAGARLQQEGPGSASDLALGQYVAVIASPEGGVATIRIYPRGLPTPRPGKVLLAGSQQGQIATFGSITSVQRTSFTVSTAGGQTVLFGLSPTTEVRKPVPASPADLTAGRPVVASGVIGIDGVLAASALSLPGAPLQTVQ